MRIIKFTQTTGQLFVDLYVKKLPFLRKLIRVLFRDSIMTVQGENNSPFKFRPSEYPRLFLGLNRFEETNLVNWKILLNPNDIIFDIGANIGLTVQRFYSILNGKCKIYAFEPLPRNIELLKVNVSNLEHDNIKLFYSAVGDFCGEVDFIDNINHGGLSKIKDNIVPDNINVFWREKTQIKVQILTLDSIMKKEKEINFPNFIKIDVEGSAGNVLRGARKLLMKSKPIIYCSIHGSKEHTEVMEELINCNYQGLIINNGSKIRCDLEISKGLFVPIDN